jgi:hypothetical protein
MAKVDFRDRRAVKQKIEKDLFLALKNSTEPLKAAADQVLFQEYLDQGVFKSGRSLYNREVTLKSLKKSVLLRLSTGKFTNNVFGVTMSYIRNWFIGDYPTPKPARPVTRTAGEKFVERMKRTFKFKQP